MAADTHPLDDEGRPHGEWLTVDAQGRPLVRVRFVHGLLEGRAEALAEGQVVVSADYRAGQLEGELRHHRASGGDCVQRYRAGRAEGAPVALPAADAGAPNAPDARGPVAPAPSLHQRIERWLKA